MRILSCMFGPRRGGFHQRYARALAALASSGNSLDYVAWRELVLPALPEGAVSAHLLPLRQTPDSLSFWPLFFRAASRRLDELAAQNRYQLIFLFDPVYAAILAPVAERHGIPMQLHIRLNPRARGYGRISALAEPFSRRLIRKGIQAADSVVVQNEALAGQIAADFQLKNPPQLLANDVMEADLGRFDSAEKRRALGLASESIVVSMISRLARGKHPEIFLRALARARKREPRLLGLLVGEGPNERPLQALAEELDLGEGLRFLGWREDCAELLALSAAAVHASYFEGSPNSLLEAMVQGRPCFASDIPEIEALLPLPELLFSNDAAGEEKLTGLLQTLAEPRQAAAWGRACRQAAEPFFFDWDARLIELAQACASKRQPSGPASASR